MSDNLGLFINEALGPGAFEAMDEDTKNELLAAAVDDDAAEELAMRFIDTDVDEPEVEPEEYDDEPSTPPSGLASRIAQLGRFGG